MRLNRVTIGIVGVAVLVVAIALGMGAASLVQSRQPAPVAQAGTPTPPPPTDAPASEAPTGSIEAPSPTAAPTATPEPTPTPAPTPVLVPAPLTGVPVSPKVAQRPVIAVQIDDQFDARPQSGLSSASVVWQAPAEGGIPRYIAFFQEGSPPSVGPIRSSRLYFVAWASEWDAVHVHVGGSPQAVALLRGPKGKGTVVYDADYVRWGGGSLMWRVTSRFAPHNVYSSGKALRRLAALVGSPSITKAKPHWQFAPDAPLEQRPVGGRIVVPYPANTITYNYDRATNTYLRSVTGEGKQYDVGPKKKVRIAPKNVVVMTVPFVPIGDAKHRLDGQVVGTGPAWFFTNGQAIKGTWQKKSFTAPTRFFDARGKPVTFTIGQTFVQVVPRGTAITIKRGTPPPPPATLPSPSPSTAP